MTASETRGRRAGRGAASASKGNKAHGRTERCLAARKGGERAPVERTEKGLEVEAQSGRPGWERRRGGKGLGDKARLCGRCVVFSRKREAYTPFGGCEEALGGCVTDTSLASPGDRQGRR